MRKGPRTVFFKFYCLSKGAEKRGFAGDISIGFVLRVYDNVAM
jgi:hypothetical protein